MSEPADRGWAAPDHDGVPSFAPPLRPDARAGQPEPATQPPTQPPPVGQPGWGGSPTWGGSPGWGAAQPVAPQPGVVPLRPLGLGEMLDGAVALVRGYPRAVLGVSAIVALAATLVQLLLLTTLLRPLLQVDRAALTAGDPDALLGLLAAAGGALSLAVAFSTVSEALLTGFLTAVAGRAVLGQPLSLSELWETTRGRLPRLVGSSLLLGVAVYGPPLLAGALLGGLVAVGGAAGGAVGGLLLVASFVLSLVAYVRLSLATSVIVLEDAGVRQGFRRSWLLVRRAFWRVLGVLLLTLFISAFVAQVLQLPFALLGGDGGPLDVLSGDPGQTLTTRALVLQAIGTGVATTVVAPFVAGVRALLYVDRRMRAEGLDVALQAAAAARP